MTFQFAEFSHSPSRFELKTRTSHEYKIKSSVISVFFGYWNSSLFLLTFKLCIIFLQASSQVAKLENTVETLRTVLTQKIQSEAQTVCLVTRFVGDPVFSKLSSVFVQQNRQVFLIFGED